MPLDLVKRSELAIPINSSQHDANFTAIESFCNSLENSLTGKAPSVHTHSVADVSGLQATLDAKQNTNEKGLANGYAGLDSTGKVPAAQLPAMAGGTASWGGITGTLSNQTDLQTVLNGKMSVDATLSALAGVTTAANQLIYSTGPDAFSITAFTAFARTLLDDPDATTMLATLGALPRTDLGAATVGNYRNAKRQFGSAQTLNTSTCKGGETIAYTGTGHTWTLPQRLAASDTGVTETLVIRNRGSGDITLSASGVTIRGATVIPVGKSATLEWETNGTTHWVWVDVN